MRNCVFPDFPEKFKVSISVPYFAGSLPCEIRADCSQKQTTRRMMTASVPCIQNILFRIKMLLRPYCPAENAVAFSTMHKASGIHPQPLLLFPKYTRSFAGRIPLTFHFQSIQLRAIEINFPYQFVIQLSGVIISCFGESFLQVRMKTLIKRVIVKKLKCPLFIVFNFSNFSQQIRTFKTALLINSVKAGMLIFSG
jgi:hypothetical protein